MPRPRRRVERRRSPQDSEILCRVLHGIANAPVARKRLTGTADGQPTSLRASCPHPAGRRTPPPLRTSRGLTDHSSAHNPPSPSGFASLSGLRWLACRGWLTSSMLEHGGTFSAAPTLE